MLTHLKYEYDKDTLYNEALNADNYTSFIDPLTNNVINEWRISKSIGKYSSDITEYFETVLKCKIKPRYYIQEKGFTLPFHKDRGTKCCINFVLSDMNDPIEFRTKLYTYQCALIDVQQEHKVTATSENRILFKLSIFDLSYNEVIDTIEDII